MTFSPVYANAIIAKAGMSGEKVVQVQAMLFELEILEGSIDGAFGSMTEQAVKSYQKKINAEPDGVVNQELERSLAIDSGLDFAKVKKSFSMNASAYSAQDPGCGPRTATGALVAKGIIAVDPSLIPLGTQVYIPGYGKALAADVGGAIKGHVIDIAFDTHQEALQFGRRNVNVYIM
ncbi:MAG TPA: peptidoglycan-binding protein [Candidatus Avacidaminococcus intestinavium]|uniref:Peptidoglycan-binding protein n=1 Tax=Candidatus Avacidaminococcus intestinavium TaxID=2840684 RepID=A0A9D1SLM5_9FIRM|nr:peptidoglycan-binding protein [Candidatus Avacidaminococcus intestinavium]